jgi:hypothetical protein
MEAMGSLTRVPYFFASHIAFQNLWNVKKYGASAGKSRSGCPTLRTDGTKNATAKQFAAADIR